MKKALKVHSNGAGSSVARKRGSRPKLTIVGARKAAKLVAKKRAAKAGGLVKRGRSDGSAEWERYLGHFGA